MRVRRKDHRRIGGTFSKGETELILRAAAHRGVDTTDNAAVALLIHDFVVERAAAIAAQAESWPEV